MTPSRPPGEALEARRWTIASWSDGHQRFNVTRGDTLAYGEQVEVIEAGALEALTDERDRAVTERQEAYEITSALREQWKDRVAAAEDRADRAVTALREALKLSENIGGCPALGHLTDCLEAALAAASSPGENEGEPRA